MKKQRLSFREKYELMNEVKASASIHAALSKYHITVHKWNRVIDSEPEI